MWIDGFNLPTAVFTLTTRAVPSLSLFTRVILSSGHCKTGRLFFIMIIIVPSSTFDDAYFQFDLNWNECRYSQRYLFQKVYLRPQTNFHFAFNDPFIKEICKTIGAVNGSPRWTRWCFSLGGINLNSVPLLVQEPMNLFCKLVEKRATSSSVSLLLTPIKLAALLE